MASYIILIIILQNRETLDQKSLSLQQKTILKECVLSEKEKHFKNCFKSKIMHEESKLGCIS